MFNELHHFVLSLPNEESQKLLLEFLQSVAEYYKLHQRAEDFISHLVRLNVPKLFATKNEACVEREHQVEDMFATFMREYIQKNNLHLLNKLQDIIGYIADNTHSFHRIVLNVLQLVSILMCVCFKNSMLQNHSTLESGSLSF